MENKEKRPAEMEAPTGTVTITLPDYNMFSPEEQEKAVKIMELFWMGMQVNGMKKRKKELTGNLPSVFIELWGHIGEAEFDIHPKGWEEDDRAEEIKSVRFEKPMDIFLKEYLHVNEWLHGILEGMKHDRV